MKLIASRSNPFFKHLRALARPGASLRRERQVWLEGVHLCQEYLQRVGPPLQAVFDVRRLGDGGAGAPELRALARDLPPACCIALADDLLASVSEVAGAQGVGFVVSLPQPEPPERIETSCVVLDRVQDPGNVGSIMRSCAAAGVPALYLLEGCANAWSPKVLRAGQGAHFSLTIHEQLETADLLRRMAVPLLVTALEGADDLYAADLPHPAAWVFGHEGQGVGPEFLQRAARRVFIPQASAVESLNVAAAAAVCLFEHRRRLRPA